MRHSGTWSPGTTTPEPENGDHRAYALQLLKPARPRARAPQLESGPRSQLEKSQCSSQDPEQPKQNKQIESLLERKKEREASVNPLASTAAMDHKNEPGRDQKKPHWKLTWKQ